MRNTKEIETTNLQSLFLSNNQLSGEIPKEIGKLTNLKYLYLNNNQIKEKYQKKLKNLRIYKY